MMFELKHLKTISALNSTGSIRKTAEVLFLSQSALSHQIKELEHKLDARIFIRNSSPVQFTEQGQILLNLAQKVLPEVENATVALKGQALVSYHLSLAFACHACFQWLLPVTQALTRQNPAIKFEFIDPLFPADNQQADILFTDQITTEKGFICQEIGIFELVAVVAKQNPLAKKAFLLPEDFQTTTLLTYPVKMQQLDIFTLFLNKNNVSPDKVKQVTNSHMMLQMAAADMGIATLPDWLVTSLTTRSLVQQIPLGAKGIFKTLYAHYPVTHKNIKEIELLVPNACQAFASLYKVQG